METMLLRRRATGSATLTVPIPDALRDKDLEVLVVLQPISASESANEEQDAHGWPVGFFEETYGSLADDPIERLPQGELEVREVIS